MQVQEWWAKLNANERIVMYGVIITAVSWLVGLVIGGGGYGFVAAILVTAIYWLKYSSSNMTWPAPVQTIVLVISGIAAILGILFVLPFLGFAGYLLGGLWFIGAIGGLVGTLVMTYGAWRDYQAMPKTSA